MASNKAKLVFSCMLALALSACAFPKSEPFKGDPLQYSNAFQAAATEAVVAHLTGRGFYEHFEGSGYGLPSRLEPCTPEGLRAFIALERQCWLLLPMSRPDCVNAEQCMIWAIDPAVSRDPELWSIIQAALALPCAHLTNPADLPSQYRATPMKHPKSSFDLLECQGGGVIAESVQLSPDGMMLKAKFVKRPGGWFARPAYRGRGRVIGVPEKAPSP